MSGYWFVHTRLCSCETLPKRFPSPYAHQPHPLARSAAEILMEDVRSYMFLHPESELHRRGKMFGVLVVRRGTEIGYLRAFSAMLDGSYHHPGFVPPVYEVDMSTLVGKSADDSREKQQWLFHQYRFLNALGEEKDLMDIFRDVAPIMSPEEFFSQRRTTAERLRVPSGAGECCGPKLLQYALTHSLQPICMAEFWMGASPKDELRIEGQYYPACSGKCRPILTHVLRGLEVEESPEWQQSRKLALRTRVIYKDDDLLVVDKPSGLLSVPGREGQYSLQQYLTEQYGEVYAVHRLDQDTSGLIVFARNLQVATLMQQLFLRRDLHKLYLAELEHLPALLPKEGTISLPLLANPLDRPRQMVNIEHGKPAITRYLLTQNIGPHGGPIVELYPATGRTHQLRVHCAHPDGLNAPIYGDRLYGSPASDGATRLMLHAAQLRFEHPVTHEMLDLSAESSFS